MSAAKPTGPVALGLALAATLTPNAATAKPTDDVRRIQRAIDEAEPGALLRLPAGRVRGQLRITKPLTVRGAGSGRTVFASPGPRASLMVEAKDGVVIVEGVGFTTTPDAEPTRGAAVMIAGPGMVVLRDVKLERAIAGRCITSAIALERGPSVRMERVTVSGHHCYLAGAMVVPRGAKVTLSDSVIRDNRGELAGAILVMGGELRVENTTFEGNRFTRGEDGHHITFGPGRSTLDLVASRMATDASTSLSFEKGSDPRIHVSRMRWPEPRTPDFVRGAR